MVLMKKLWKMRKGSNRRNRCLLFLLILLIFVPIFSMSVYAYDNEADRETLHLYANDILIRDFRVKELRQSDELEALILEKVQAAVREDDSAVIRPCCFQSANLEYVRSRVGEYDAFLYYTDSKEENFIRITVKVVEGETSQETTVESDTQVPDTQAPDTQVPDTQVPDTQAPDTQVPDTEAPDTQVPDTQAPDTQTSATDTTVVSPINHKEVSVSYRFANTCLLVSAGLIVLAVLTSIRKLQIIRHYSHKKRIGDNKKYGK